MCAYLRGQLFAPLESYAALARLAELKTVLEYVWHSALRLVVKADRWC